jgi:hypothetical protein
VRDDGRPLFPDFHSKDKSLFLQARKHATEYRDLASVAVMLVMLAMSGNGVAYDCFAFQLAKEYEVDIDECYKITVHTSAGYRELLERIVVAKARFLIL